MHDPFLNFKIMHLLSLPLPLSAKFEGARKEASFHAPYNKNNFPKMKDFLRENFLFFKSSKKIQKMRINFGMKILKQTLE